MQLVFVLTWHIAWELKLIHNWRTLERKTGKVRWREREREGEKEKELLNANQGKQQNVFVTIITE